MSWPYTRVDGLCAEVVDCPHSTPKWTDSGVRVLRSKNIRGGRLLLDAQESFTTESEYLKRTRRAVPCEGDLVITREAPMGEICMLPDLQCCLGQRMVLLRPNRKKVEGKFLLYAFQSRYVQGQIAKSKGTGTTVSNLRIPHLCAIEIPTPTLDEQRRIAGTLTAYDDLIENNRRRIQLLEESARLLYKEWFIHLRFPGHEHVKVIDGVPQGWELTTVASVCAGFEDGDWIETKDQGGEDYRLLQVSNIGNNSFVETGNFRYVTERTFRRLRCNEVVPGDVLISRMPKLIGRAWYVQPQPWRMITAVDVTIARPDPELINPFYFLYHLNSEIHIARCEAHATGATRQRISRKNMGRLPILRPPESLMRPFGELAAAANTQQHLLTLQNSQLAKARDLLLPRLMNGEVAT